MWKITYPSLSFPHTHEPVIQTSQHPSLSHSHSVIGAHAHTQVCFQLPSFPILLHSEKDDSIVCACATLWGPPCVTSVLPFLLHTHSFSLHPLFTVFLPPLPLNTCPIPFLPFPPPPALSAAAHLLEAPTPGTCAVIRSGTHTQENYVIDSAFKSRSSSHLLSCCLSCSPGR